MTTRRDNKGWRKLDVDEVKVIRYNFHKNKHSISRLARDNKSDRGTIRKVINYQSPYHEMD